MNSGDRINLEQFNEIMLSEKHKMTVPQKEIEKSKLKEQIL